MGRGSAKRNAAGIQRFAGQHTVTTRSPWVITFDTIYSLDKPAWGLLHFGQYHYRSPTAVSPQQKREVMSLVVKLEDDLGERSDWVMLHGVVPATNHSDFLLLNGIDPFGKTVFNHLQMETFLREWDLARDRVRDESQLEAWEKVKLMAESCRHDRDLYLRFVGN